MMEGFHPCVQEWFQQKLGPPTQAQSLAWPAIFEGKHTLLLAPTGTGKTLAAFLVALTRLMFQAPGNAPTQRVLYISPLKALGSDVERNLRIPILGIAEKAQLHGIAHRIPSVFVRSGDTKSSERAKMGRHPPDILITTPESLFLMLTSQARSALASIETVIIDEIHSLLAGKRGAHLSLSLERLESLRKAAGEHRPLQRIGLSATQKPPEEAARFLGGYEVKARSQPELRPVCILNAGVRKQWDLRVQMPEIASRALPAPGPKQPKPAGEAGFWASFVPELKELVLAHKSTMIFANSRRLSERLAAALNEEAQEELALAHHGSIAKEDRRIIEERLKSGDLRAIVATSSLELGIDVGSVDLVLQIEAPYSVASGLQRIGRAGHSVGAVSKGIVLPKYKGDLLCCAAAVALMRAADVEPTQCLSNPIDVLAQQIVAIASMDSIDTEELYALTRRSACFSELSRTSFEGVLDMLSGKYPSDAFSELRPRINWDRESGLIRAREGAKQVAVANAGTIPDRGLYGVFLASDEGGSGRRVGELDEEMVFESKPGEVFLLGASSWRIEEIGYDRVLVSPAPGEPGKMPFWRGDKPGRPEKLGQAMGELCRRIADQGLDECMQWLMKDHGLDEAAARALWAYVHEELDAIGEVPSDQTIVFERYSDEMGALCICVMAPFGARVFAPWHLAVSSYLKQKLDKQIDSIWSDDGMVFRLPDAEAPPPIEWFLPKSSEVMDMVTAHLGESSMFAAHFRECAARALLLPRRRPGKRSPLWAQRRRSADLLSVASRFQSFPIVLETFRECLRDVFDMNALGSILHRIEQKHIRIRSVDSRRASPFAASLMFSYVANFLYETDAPLAERRAHALSVDMNELRALLGDAEMQELFDADTLIELEANLQRRSETRKAYSEDSLHDMLLSLGDLTVDEIKERTSPPGLAQSLCDALLAQKRVFAFCLPNADMPERIAAVEDFARLRDALGIRISIELPKGLLAAAEEPLLDLIGRYARTHGPFPESALCKRFGLGRALVHSALQALSQRGQVVEGAFLRPDASPEAAQPQDRQDKQWVQKEVLRALKQKTLAKLRKQAEPVGPEAFARFLLDFHGILRPRKGTDALIDVLHQLKGLPLPISVLERDILPARLKNYRASDLDLLCASGEWLWVGIEAMGQNDGRIALFPADEAALLRPRRAQAQSAMAARVREVFMARGALFFSDLLSITQGFAPEILSALWELVWAGELTNDTLAPLRSLLRASEGETPRRGALDQRRGGRANFFGGFGAGAERRRAGPPGSEGRWTLLAREPEQSAPSKAADTKRTARLASMLLERHGIVSRDSLSIEELGDGDDYNYKKPVFDVLSLMEEAGRARRGFFVSFEQGLPAMQFALPGAEEKLRALRDAPAQRPGVVLAATDPANPYGALLPWPERPSSSRPMRAAGAYVVLVDGALTAFLGRSKKSLLFFGAEASTSKNEGDARFLKAAQALAQKVQERGFGNLLIEQIDGADALNSPHAALLLSAGFTRTGQGLFKRRSASLANAEDEAERE